MSELQLLILTADEKSDNNLFLEALKSVLTSTAAPQPEN